MKRREEKEREGRNRKVEKGREGKGREGEILISMFTLRKIGLPNLTTSTNHLNNERQKLKVIF